MRERRIWHAGRLIPSLLLLFAITPAFAQPVSESLTMQAQNASTWSDNGVNIILLQGPVTINLDRATLTARNAVVWLTPVKNSVLDQQTVEISLLGEAKLTQADVERAGDRLFVNATVRGNVRLSAAERLSRDMSDTDTYRDGVYIRPLSAGASGAVPTQQPWVELPPTTAPTSQPSLPRIKAPVVFSSDSFDSIQTPEGKMALVLGGHVVIYQNQADGTHVESQADRAVVYTTLNGFRDLRDASHFQEIQDAIESAYLEGDVRINYTNAQGSEQRMSAQRAYYEFATDRAVMTEGVVHAVEPKLEVPLIVRAETIRQLSAGEFRAENAQLTTSSFAVPSYSIRADRTYVRTESTGDPRLGDRTTFVANGATFDAMNVPLFYFPVIAGSLTERGVPLRQLQFGSARGFGPGVRTDWGLFETLGQTPPENLDLSFRADYFSRRGPATGLDGDYQGGFATETTKQPWNFKGDFTSYIVHDTGIDRLGESRAKVEPPDEIRGRFLWEHQHYLPDHWQVQLRGGYSSDATFLEEWFERDFNEGQGQDLSAYLKRQEDTEALTFLLKYNPNNFVTSSEWQQEQFSVNKLPELSYQRIGDDLGSNDEFTFFSSNTVSALEFDPSGASLAEQGFDVGRGQSAGLPSVGRTGITDSVNYRGDFRQEIDWPVSMGQFKTVPYIVGRYTGYSDSPTNSNPQRVLVGAGVRVSTAFWKVDDSADSQLWDIHRIRHVVEPELQLFTSAATVDQNDLLLYDESIDEINDVSAVSIGIRQTWQTKRGGPGRWRSVDFFSLNVTANFFANKPDDALLNPRGFRGLFFESVPEESIPRDSINADAMWRLSDTTVILADEQYNLNEQNLATASIGLAVQRDPRVSYFVGTRYIGQINSTVASFAMSYQLTAKYQFGFSTNYDIGGKEAQSSNFTIIRRFDRFYTTFTVYYDATDGQGGFNIGIFPEGFGYGLSSNQFNQVFSQQ